jgi:hypothetical protein
MKYKICSLVVCLLSCTVVADTWTVDVNGSGDYVSIQEAIIASSDGDDIQVMPGTYVIPLNEVVNTLGKAIWIYSTDGPDVTIIDGQGLRGGIACVNGEGSETIIEGSPRDGVVERIATRATTGAEAQCLTRVRLRIIKQTMVLAWGSDPPA